MAGSRKKSKAQVVDGSDLELFDLFTEVYLEQIESDKIKDDPLEAYVEKLRLHFYKNADLFGNRFKRGYQVLLEDLLKK
jgi:hypothetical protein